MNERYWSPQHGIDHRPVFSPSTRDLEVDPRGKYRADVVVNGKRLILACVEGMDTYELFFPDLVDLLDDAAKERGIWDYSLRLSADADLSVAVFWEAVRLAEETETVQDLYLAVIPHLEAALRHQEEANFLSGRRIAYDRPMHLEREVNGVRLSLDAVQERPDSPLASPLVRYVLRIGVGAFGAVPRILELGTDRDEALDAFLFAQEAAERRWGKADAVWKAVKAYVSLHSGGPRR